MKKTRNLLVVITAILAWAAIAIAYEAKDYVTYFGTTNGQLTVSWDAQEVATHYEVVLYHVERKVEVPAASGRTETNSIIFKVPRSGHFIARIRACDAKGCSDWVESTDATYCLVDGKPRGWWIYGHVASPGTIDIYREP